MLAPAHKPGNNVIIICKSIITRLCVRNTYLSKESLKNVVYLQAAFGLHVSTADTGFFKYASPSIFIQVALAT